MGDFISLSILLGAGRQNELCHTHRKSELGEGGGGEHGGTSEREIEHQKLFGISWFSGSNAKATLNLS